MFAFKLISKSIRLPVLQNQVRHARKSFRLRLGYGRAPLDHEDYLAAKRDLNLEDLRFEQIRFATNTENASPLRDKDLDEFTRYIMKSGEKELAEALMHDTFYRIKSIQYAKLLKQTQETSQEDPSEQATPSQEENQDETIEMNPLVILKGAIENCKPLVVVKKVRRGGATYQVPFPLLPSSSRYLSIKWLHKAVLERPKPRKKRFCYVMAQELLDAFYGRGKVIKKRDDMHRLADANKAFAHYRWG